MFQTKETALAKALRWEHTSYIKGHKVQQGYNKVSKGETEWKTVKSGKQTMWEELDYN